MNTLAQMALTVSTSILLSILVKATVVLMVALLAVRCARRAPASVRHLVLVSGFAVVLLLPLLTIGAPPIAVALSVSSVQPGPVHSSAIGGEQVHPASNSEQTAARVSTGRTSLVARDALAAAWAVGVLLFLIPVFITPWRTRQLRRTAWSWPRGQTLAARLASNAGITRHVTAIVSDGVDSPLTCGVIRPAVVLPADAPEWDERDIRRALTHELEHVRRMDWPVHVAARCVCALYWFHPLVWATWRHLALESERACDDAVVRLSGGTGYAQQLLTLAKRQVRRSLVPRLAMAAPSDLSTRIGALLDRAQLRGRVGIVRGSVIVSLAGVVAITVAPLRAEPAQDRAESREVRKGRLAFDVASVRQNKSGSDQGFLLPQGGQLAATNYRLRNLILFAYRLQPFQLVDGPNWIESARFDIVARAGFEPAPAPPGAPPGQMQLMLQTLLTERFRLRVHTETRELPIYALVPVRRDGRLGPRLRPAAADCAAVMNAAAAGKTPTEMPMRPDGRPVCGMMGGQGRFFAGGTTLSMLAAALSEAVGRVVTDRTGLTGAFDADLEFSPEPLNGVPARDDGAQGASPDRPSIFTALEEQLGLKLEPARGPVEVLVIDHAELPTEN